MKAREYKIDAKGKKLGRVASEAAKALMGKDDALYEPQKNTGARVVILGAGGLSIDEKKRDGKIYKRYSGYPSGQKMETLAEVMERKGVGEALRRAIYGMLPANKLRSKRMKNLTISD